MPRAATLGSLASFSHSACVERTYPHVVLLVLSLVICLACATPFPVDSLEEGMTTETVRAEFGEPEEILSNVVDRPITKLISESAEHGFRQPGMGFNDTVADGDRVRVQ
jgi:hypothetical protein